MRTVDWIFVVLAILGGVLSFIGALDKIKNWYASLSIKNTRRRIRTLQRQLDEIYTATPGYGLYLHALFLMFLTLFFLTGAFALYLESLLQRPTMNPAMALEISYLLGGGALATASTGAGLVRGVINPERRQRIRERTQKAVRKLESKLPPSQRSTN